MPEFESAAFYHFRAVLQELGLKDRPDDVEVSSSYGYLDTRRVKISTRVGGILVNGLIVMKKYGKQPLLCSACSAINIGPVTMNVAYRTCDEQYLLTEIRRN